MTSDADLIAKISKWIGLGDSFKAHKFLKQLESRLIYLRAIEKEAMREYRELFL